MDEIKENIETKPFYQQKYFWWLIGVMVVVLLVTTVYFWQKSNSEKALNEKINEVLNETVTADESPEGTEALNAEPLFSGKLTRLDQDLHIFKSTESEPSQSFNSISYYSAGVFLRGELKDYTRIIAIRQPEGPGGALTFVLATKDWQTYILDDPNKKAEKFPTDSYSNPYSELGEKVTATRVFDTEQPSNIELNDEFALYTKNIVTQSSTTGTKDSFNNDIYEVTLLKDFSTYQPLSSPDADLNIFFKKFEFNPELSKELDEAGKESNRLRQLYLQGETEVVVVDSVGLPVTYVMTTPENIKQYVKDYAEYETALIKYELAKDSIVKPKYPDYVFPPNLGFASSQIDASVKTEFYNDYQTAIPNLCSATRSSKVVNVNESDLEPVGSVFGLPLYRLKDKNSEFYKYAYDNKLFYYDTDAESATELNNGLTKPSFAEYVEKNPLLFVQNYWKQWVALGEYDYILPGGCGKPVVYLYPTQPTDVTVTFQKPIQFTTSIPTYTDSWRVRAHEDGRLKDLQPELTDCQAIDDRRHGSEYAKEACLKNNYPYLYWAGNASHVDYPTVNEGWVVSRNELEGFLNRKLTEVGLNNSERRDFTDYWLAELLSKNNPYFKISFLQTNELNGLFPMTVTPSPDSVFRIFLDYQPLSAKPEALPQPQTLNKLHREGFTLVEWGGLKY